MESKNYRDEKTGKRDERQSDNKFSTDFQFLAVQCDAESQVTQRECIFLLYPPVKYLNNQITHFNN